MNCQFYRFYHIILCCIVCCLSAGAVGAKTVTDQAGRIINIPDDPQQVVSLAPSITEIVFALNQEARLAGVTRFSDYPPETDKLPKVGSYIQLDLEKIVALKPDLCIAIKDGNPIDIVRRIESMNIPVYAVNPKSLNTVMQAVADIGFILNAQPRAEALIHEMQTRIQQVQELSRLSGRSPTVFFQIGISPIVAVGTDTFIHELIVTAGGSNLTAGPTPYPRFTKEQVISLAPEVIIITSMARNEIFMQVKTEWERWTHIPAAKNQRIHTVDSNLFDRPAPRMIDGLEMLLGLLHPEIAAPQPADNSP